MADPFLASCGDVSMSDEDLPTTLKDLSSDESDDGSDLAEFVTSDVTSNELGPPARQRPVTCSAAEISTANIVTGKRTRSRAPVVTTDLAPVVQAWLHEEVDLEEFEATAELDAARVRSDSDEDYVPSDTSVSQMSDASAEDDSEDDDSEDDSEDDEDDY